MLNVAFAGTGTFPANLEQPVRRHLTTPCEIIVASEIDILSRLAEIDMPPPRHMLSISSMSAKPPLI